jgi:hypothetical protein
MAMGAFLLANRMAEMEKAAIAGDFVEARDLLSKANADFLATNTAVYQAITRAAA